MRNSEQMKTGFSIPSLQRDFARPILIAGVLLIAPGLCSQAPQPAPQSFQPAQTGAALQLRPQQASADPISLADPGPESHLIAIVPLDSKIPGHAFEVTGDLKVSNGRAFIAANGSIASGDQSTHVTLPYRGTLLVCAYTTVKLTANSSVPGGEVPGLMMALEHGAVEMSFAAGRANTRNADFLLTPDFRILIGGPGAADVKVRLGPKGTHASITPGRARRMCWFRACSTGAPFACSRASASCSSTATCTRWRIRKRSPADARLRRPRETSFRWRRVKDSRRCPSRLLRSPTKRRLDAAGGATGLQQRRPRAPIGRSINAGCEFEWSSDRSQGGHPKEARTLCESGPILQTHLRGRIARKLTSTMTGSCQLEVVPISPRPARLRGSLLAPC